eukprot:122786-Hanusia_phi.AAC.1
MSPYPHPPPGRRSRQAAGAEAAGAGAGLAASSPLSPRRGQQHGDRQHGRHAGAFALGEAPVPSRSLVPLLPPSFSLEPPRPLQHDANFVPAPQKPLAN